MSYILDALRKSDQQRRLGGVPGLPAASVVAAVPERSPLLLQGLLGLTLIIATVTTIAWLRPWSPVTAPVPAMVAISAVKAPPLSPLAQSPQNQIAPAVLPQAAAVPASAPIPVAPLAPRKPSASPVPDTYRPVPAPVATRPARAAMAKADEPAGNPPSDEAPRPNFVASSVLPASIRKQLPPLTVAVHAYSDIPQERLVSINGRLLREGDTLAPDLRLEQITPEGMIFTFRGYRFQRAAQ
jgi:general secretion pathway protein B